MAEKVVTLVPLVTISVFREGEFKAAPIGKPFEFYEGEVADIKRAETAEGKVMAREPLKEETPVSGKILGTTGKGKAVDEI